MTSGNETFSRVVIDAQLADQGWNTLDHNSVRFWAYPPKLWIFEYETFVLHVPFAGLGEPITLPKPLVPTSGLVTLLNKNPGVL